MHTVKQALKDRLRKLHDTMGVSGNEQEVARLIMDEITPFADEVRISTVGNVVAIKHGRSAGPALCISAHMDEIGFIVKSILPSGFVLFEKVGTAPDNIMLGRKVLVSGRRIPGIIGTKPGHLQTPEEARTVLPAARCYIDLGLNSAEEVAAAGVRVGDPIIFKSDFMEMHNPDIVATRAVDDRMGCAVILELFERLNADDFAGTLYGVFTVREEVGLHGARTALYGLGIDYCIALDTIPCGDTPDIDTLRQLPIYLGRGPALSVVDGMMPTFFQHVHPGIRRIIEEKAEACSVNLQFCTILGHAYTTDAAALAYIEAGIPMAGLAIPRRYSHSPVEMVHMQDAADLLSLLEAVVRDNASADLSFI